MSDDHTGSAEKRFRDVFAHLGAVSAYARRRGSADPEAIAAEVMAIAWRRLADVPIDDARPWLFATARNLVLAEWRQRNAAARHEQRRQVAPDDAAGGAALIDPDILAALRSLRESDREALLLIAWDDLTPKLAARAVGISHAAFRVRLHRARARFTEALAASQHGMRTRPRTVEMENG